MSMQSSSSNLDFKPATLPWLDRLQREIDDYVRVQGGTSSQQFALRYQLLHWMAYGFVVLEQAIEPPLIDALLADMEELFADHRRNNVLIVNEKVQYLPINTIPKEDLLGTRLRISDFHSKSIAAKKISLHRRILDFLRHVFREPVAVFQSLTFLEGSQQEIHQDYAYVVPREPSHLAASWVALEDVQPDAGPLTYYPGSHSVRKFDWGDGMFRTPRSPRSDNDFSRHIHAACQAAGLQANTFLPKKGDVFIWHAALAHGGTQVTRRGATRRSYVTHYSTASTMNYNWRFPDQEAPRYEHNGGLAYGDPMFPDEEDCFRNGELL